MTPTKSATAIGEIQIEECSDAKVLLAELHSLMGKVLQNIGRMAAIVRRLDELGIEVAIENTILPYVRLIGHGQLSADLFVACSGDQDLLKKAMRLPMPLQEQIAANEPMKIITELNGDHRLVRPLDMTKTERRQLFYGSRLRNAAEQIGWLREQQQIAKTRALPPSDEPDIVVDKKKKGIVVRGQFIPLHDLIGFVSTLSAAR